jgi:hypothetical protein
MMNCKVNAQDDFINKLYEILCNTEEREVFFKKNYNIIGYTDFINSLLMYRIYQLDLGRGQKVDIIAVKNNDIIQLHYIVEELFLEPIDISILEDVLKRKGIDDMIDWHKKNLHKRFTRYAGI